MKTLPKTIESIASSASRHAAIYAAARSHHPFLTTSATIACPPLIPRGGE